MKTEELNQKLKKVQETPQLRNVKSHRLLQDHVLIKAVQFEEKGKVYNPRQYGDKPEYGIVVAVGQGRLLDNGTRVPCPVKPGDFVIFGKYASVKINTDGEDFLFVRDEEIMSVYEGEEEIRGVGKENTG